MPISPDNAFNHAAGTVDEKRRYRNGDPYEANRHFEAEREADNRGTQNLRNK